MEGRRKNKSYLSKNFSLFTVESHQAEQRLDMPDSVHETKLVQRMSSSNHLHHYVYKNNTKIEAEIEAFNALCFEVLLGEHTAKVKLVHDNKKKIIGTVSELIPDYYSFAHYFDEHDNQLPDIAELLESEFCRLWVAVYTETENDFHLDNYGYGKNSKNESICVKLDHGNASWPVLAKHEKSHLLAEYGNDRTANLHRADIRDKFAISIRDIVTFPLIKDAHPYHCISNTEATLKFQDLKDHPGFLAQKYFTFLKRILLDVSLFEAFATATISNSHIRKDLVAHKEVRTRELAKTLIQIPGFRKYILENPEVIDNIVAEFEHYNLTHTHKKNRSLDVDIDKVRERYAALQKQCEYKQPKVNTKKPAKHSTTGILKKLKTRAEHSKTQTKKHRHTRKKKKNSCGQDHAPLLKKQLTPQSMFKPTAAKSDKDKDGAPLVKRKRR